MKKHSKLLLLICALVGLFGAVVMAEPSTGVQLVFNGIARSPGTYNSTTFGLTQSKGARLHLHIYGFGTSFLSTNGNLNVKIQEFDTVSAQYLDVTGLSFAQQTAAGDVDLQVYPGISELSNRRASQTIPTNHRVVATVAGTACTFSLSETYVPNP